MRKMSIGENYERKLTPIRSNISRFSRGTDTFLSKPDTHLSVTRLSRE